MSKRVAWSRLPHPLQCFLQADAGGFLFSRKLPSQSNPHQYRQQTQEFQILPKGIFKFWYAPPQT